MAQIARISGRHVFAAIAVFFGVVILANAAFIALAIRSFPGESPKKSYLQGLHYNDALAERAAQKALRWRAEVVRAERTGAGGEIALRLYDASGAPLGGLSVDGVAKRPADDNDDHEISFDDRGGGVYGASVESLAPGVWDLTARAQNDAGETFDITSRIIVE